MKCRRDILLQFIGAELDVDQTEEVLRHLDSCRECTGFVDFLVRLKANREQLRNLSQEPFASTLPLSRPWRLRAPGADTTGLRPLILAGLGLAAMLLLALGGLALMRAFRQNQMDIAPLAVRVPYPYRPLVFRGAPVSPDLLLSEAVTHYQQGKFVDAIPLLKEYLEKRSADADVHFYLGVSQYMSGEFNEARDSLETGLRLRTIQGEEKFHWFLAQVHLRCREKEAAIRELNAVVSLRGEFQQPAEALLSQLR